jgi:hypothetical protein
MPNIGEAGVPVRRFGLAVARQGEAMRSGSERDRCGVPGPIQFHSLQGAIMLRVRRCLGLGVLLALGVVLSLSAVSAQTGDKQGDDKKLAGEKKDQVKEQP